MVVAVNKLYFLTSVMFDRLCTVTDCGHSYILTFIQTHYTQYTNITYNLYNVYFRAIIFLVKYRLLDFH